MGPGIYDKLSPSSFPPLSPPCSSPCLYPSCGGPHECHTGSTGRRNGHHLLLHRQCHTPCSDQKHPMVFPRVWYQHHYQYHHGNSPQRWLHLSGFLCGQTLPHSWQHQPVVWRTVLCVCEQRGWGDHGWCRTCYSR